MSPRPRFSTSTLCAGTVAGPDGKLPQQWQNLVVSTTLEASEGFFKPGETMRDLVTQAESGLARALLDSTHERRRPMWIGLAGRLIALIAAFVMIAEITIFIPAIANFRYNWVRNRLAAAYTAALVLETAPQGLVSDDLARKLLTSVGARLIVINKSGARHVLAVGDMPAKIDELYDLRNPTWPDMLHAAFRTLTASGGRVLTFLGAAPNGGDAVEVTMDEAPLKKALEHFSRRLLIYSLIVSAIVGALAAFALHRMILRPVRRLTTSIVDFGADPSDRSRIIAPSRSTHDVR